MKPSSTPSASALALCLAVVRANANLIRRFDGRLGSWHGISFAEFTILLELSRAPSLRLRRIDLANAVGLTPSAVTRALIPLEKIGLVRRQSDPRDARVGYAVLTPAGRRRVDEAMEAVEMISGEAISDGDLGPLASALKEID
jgi:DNA-binding MarR family transcriptional regulator